MCVARRVVQQRRLGGAGHVHPSACSVAAALSSLRTEELVSFVQVVARPFRADA